MKKKITFDMLSLVLLVAFLFCGSKAMAQDEPPTGYANVWYDIKVVNEKGGKVAVLANQSGIKTWSTNKKFEQTVQTSVVEGFDVFMFFLFAQADTANGYIFAGWYVDEDGDGEFNIEKDKLWNFDSECMMLASIDENTPIYNTQAEAKAGQKPTSSMGTIFALFSRGATVGLSYHQDETWGNCGSVFVDKLVNEPGDKITIRALPNDGYTFLYWKNEFDHGQGEIVSRDNPYTFTVKGGEKLFAYFRSDDAPSVSLPEEGGYYIAKYDRNWILSEEAIKNGAHVVNLEAEDLVKSGDKVYLDANRPDADDIENYYTPVANRDLPTLIYGKGNVDFDFNFGYGFGRYQSTDALVKWSFNGIELKGGGTPLYVYVFSNELGAFIQYGNTDTLADPNAPSSIRVPKNVAYFSIQAAELADDNGNIPMAIGLSPESYDYAIAGVTPTEITSKGMKNQKMYSLSGIEVQPTSQKGIFIVNGKKVVIK